MAEQPRARRWYLWQADGQLVVRAADGSVRPATDDERHAARLALEVLRPTWRRRPPRTG